MVRDLDEVYKLFSVVEKAQGHPKLKPIFDQAMAALEAHAAALTAPQEVEEGEPDEEEAPAVDNGRRL